MKITRQQLRRVIRESLLQEKAIASVSDITRSKGIVDEWAGLLLDELQESLPNGAAMADWSDKVRQQRIEGLRGAVNKYLIGALGTGLDAHSRRRQKWKEEEKISKHHLDQKRRGLR